MSRRQRRRRFQTAFEEDSQFHQSHQQEAMYYSQSTPTCHKRQRAAISYPYVTQRCESPPDSNLFDNRFSPDERHFEELEDENRMLHFQLDEGEKLKQEESKQEKANLKLIADLDKRCHDFNDRVLELKEQRQKAEEKLKEEVAANKSLQGEKSRLVSECSRQEAEMQNVIKEKMKAENELKDARKRANEDKERVSKVNQQKSAELEKIKKELEKSTKMNKDLEEQKNKQEKAIKEVTRKLNKAQEEVNKKDGRLKQYKELEEKCKKLEKEMKSQRLEELRNKKHDVPLKAASEQLQVNLNRMRSQKQKQSTKLAALQKDLEKNQNLQRDAQGRLQQYTDHFGNQTAAEISAQYQQLETTSKETIGKLRGDLNRAEHELKIQRITENAEVAKNQADCENSEQMRRQLQSLEAESTDLKNTIKQLEEQLQAKTKELKEATDTCQTQQEELASQQKELREHKSQLDEFKKAKSEEASELSELQNRAANLHEKLTRTEQQLSAKDEHMANLKQELAELHRHLGVIISRIDQQSQGPVQPSNVI